MRIRMLTWNMGSNRKTESEWLDEMKKTWALATDADCTAKQPLTKWCFDVLAVTVQEDYKGTKYGRFPDAIGAFLGPAEWEMHTSIVEGPPDVLNKPFTVKLYVFVNKARMPVGTTFSTAGLCLQKQLKFFCSKGTAGVSMNVPGKGQVIMMGSHFPIKTKEKDLGYQNRIIAIKESLNGVFNKLRRTDAPNTVAIWGGDMNFRRNTLIPSGIVASDQLNYARQQQGAFNVFQNERFEEQPLLFPPTCKLHSCKKLECPVCRIHSDSTDDLQAYIDTEEKKEACYDSHRTESHCDRILYYVSGKNVTLQPKAYKSWSNGSVLFSDHNLVWADFELRW
jgi:hypothetical protein